MTNDEYVKLKSSYHAIGRLILDYEAKHKDLDKYIGIAEKICKFNNTELSLIQSVKRGNENVVNIKKQISHVLFNRGMNHDCIGTILNQDRSTIYNQLRTYSNDLDNYKDYKERHKELLNFLEYEK